MNQQPILIQVAMEVECRELLKKINKLKEIEIDGYKYYEGEINNYPVVVSLSKVGLINTSSSLTIAKYTYNPQIIINLGIAGATTKDLHVKDIVVGESCLNINSYRTANLKEQEGTNPYTWELLTFLSGEEDRMIIEAANSQLLALTKNIDYQEGRLCYGRIGSGDAWNREIDRILYLNDKYQILCEDMESIATYTLANKWHIPVISLKIISDNSLTKEEYNREVGLYLEEYALQYLTHIVANILENKENNK